MSTPTFTWTPSWTPKLTKKPRVLKAQFGDGYVQTAKDGLNANPRSWAMTFSALDETDCNAILDFLDARGGSEIFAWTDPFGNDGYFRCEEYAGSRTSPLLHQVTATFIEDFRPLA